MDKLKINEVPLKCDMSQVSMLNIGLIPDHGEYRAHGRWTQTSSKHYMNPCVEYEASSNFSVKTSLSAL